LTTVIDSRSPSAATDGPSYTHDTPSHVTDASYVTGATVVVVVGSATGDEVSGCDDSVVGTVATVVGAAVEGSGATDVVVATEKVTTPTIRTVTAAIAATRRPLRGPRFGACGSSVCTIDSLL
jgi:hypothetical protein